MKLALLSQRARFRRYTFDLSFPSARGLFAQGDQSIANQAGAAFRSDLNAELQALATLSSGTAAPGTTYALMFWADTTTNQLKQRNAANSGWVIRGSLDESFVLSRSSNTILAGSDRGKTINATSAFTQTLTAAATLGDGWAVYFMNSAATACTIDPNSSETINGAATLTVPAGAGGWIVCNGSAFFMIAAPQVLSGSYTGTATGLTTSPTATFTYTKVGNAVVLDILPITGTSNSTAFTITGAPAAIRPASGSREVAVRVQDNGAAYVLSIGSMDSSGVLTLYKDANGTAFTNSGTKSLLSSSVSYTT